MFIMHSVFTFHMGPVKSTTWTPQGWQFHLHPLSKGSAMRRPRVKFQCSLRGGLVLGSYLLSVGASLPSPAKSGQIIWLPGEGEKKHCPAMPSTSARCLDILNPPWPSLCNRAQVGQSAMCHRPGSQTLPGRWPLLMTLTKRKKTLTKSCLYYNNGDE